MISTLYAGLQHIVIKEIGITNSNLNNLPISISYIPNNLSTVINAEKILDFEPILKELMESKNKKNKDSE